MTIRYKAIMIDHDDTTVDSTPKINYLSYVNFCNTIMKDRTYYTMLNLQQWYELLWEDKYYDHIKNVMKLEKHELDLEYDMWLEFIKDKHPTFFPGFHEMLVEYKKRGGIIAIVSHCDEVAIRRHYAEYQCENENDRIVPDIVYGYIKGKPELNKPNVYPVEDFKKKFNLKNEDICVIDDLSPGLIMGNNAGIDSIGVVYGEGHETIADKIKEISKYVFDSVDELSNFLLCKN